MSTKILQKGAAWLTEQRHKLTARSIRYHRRNGEAIDISATIGRSGTEETADGSIFMRADALDWIVRTVNLVDGDGVAFFPEPGDQIVDLDASPNVQYAINALGTEAPWRFTDGYQNSIRIHCKRVT